MDEIMIAVPLEDYQNKCKAEATLEIVKRFVVTNDKYHSYGDLRALLGEKEEVSQ